MRLLVIEDNRQLVANLFDFNPAADPIGSHFTGAAFET